MSKSSDPPPTHPHSFTARRFTLLDALILLATFAANLRISREVEPLLTQRGFHGFEWAEIVREIDQVRRSDLSLAFYYATFWATAAVPWLITSALALLALRMIPPRPSRARLARERGFMAMAMTAGLGAVTGVAYLFIFLTWAAMTGAANPFDIAMLLNALVVATFASGAAIAASWTVALLLGRSRTRFDWIERAGVFLGVILIASSPFYLWIVLLYLRR